MKNKLELLDTSQGWIAIFTGKTDSDEIVHEEEAHNIGGANNQERIQNALVVWGADVEQTEVTVSGLSSSQMENVIVIEDINKFVGKIPTDHDLICYEKGTDPMDGLVMYGFDEVGMFDGEFKTPAYAFCAFELEASNEI